MRGIQAEIRAQNLQNSGQYFYRCAILFGMMMVMEHSGNVACIMMLLTPLSSVISFVCFCMNQKGYGKCSVEMSK
jgi:hypothetical protein